MKLPTQLLHQIADQSLSANKRAHLRCDLAKRLEEAGNFEAARAAMGELWQRVGDRPALASLDQETAAEVLLRAGALTGWIGSTKQIEGSQEAAKDLITESISIFSSLANTEKLSAAQADLAYCYWREGAFDEARVLLQEALDRLAYSESETKAVTLLRIGIVEGSAKRFHEALRIFTEAAPLIEKSGDLFLGGKFHHSFGTLLKKLGEAEQCQDYIDRALIEFAAASFHFEQAGQPRHEACVENNLGFLFCSIGRLTEAHEHLDRAQALLTTLKDKVHLAQVDETRARVMLAEGRLRDAEKTSHRAVKALERGDEQSLLAEALTTHGIVLARLKHHERAHTVLQRAIEVAEQAGDLQSAGLAALTLIEQLGQHLSNDELCAQIESAARLLENTRDLFSVKRLAKSTYRVLFLVQTFPGRPDWTTFDVKAVLHRHEARFFELALKDSGGSVTEAARLLGLPGHQSLSAMLVRHKELDMVRKPIVTRRRAVIRGHTAGGPRKKPSRKARTKKILHVEDDSAIAGIVKQILAPEGLVVENCADGSTAMRRIASHTHYDLLLLDYDLPGLDGLELVRRARQIRHRSRTPIIILSATLDEETAQLAGANAFLRKPEDIMAVGETVARLLHQTRD